MEDSEEDHWREWLKKLMEDSEEDHWRESLKKLMEDSEEDEDSEPEIWYEEAEED